MPGNVRKAKWAKWGENGAVARQSNSTSTRYRLQSMPTDAWLSSIMSGHRLGGHVQGLRPSTGLLCQDISDVSSLTHPLSTTAQHPVHWLGPMSAGESHAAAVQGLAPGRTSETLHVP